MKRVINAEYKYYNANSRYQNKGDCVARTLSLVYRIDYNKVVNELNAIKRRLGYDSWKYLPVFTEFIRQHGYESQSDNVFLTNTSKLNDEFDEQTTVNEFSEIMTTGTYAVLCGPTPGAITHLVAIIDGNVYDSWDCSDYKVCQVCVIRSGTTDLSGQVNVNEISDNVSAMISKYVFSKIAPKMPYADFDVAVIPIADVYGNYIKVRCYLNSDIIQEAGITSGDRYAKRFPVRTRPGQDKDSALEENYNKLKVEVREWDYSIRKTIEDILAEASVQVNPKFRGSRTLLAKLPKDLQPKVVALYDNGAKSWSDKYELILEPFDDDDRNFDVDIRGQTWREVMNNLREYTENRYREGYDY